VGGRFLKLSSAMRDGAGPRLPLQAWPSARMWRHTSRRRSEGIRSGRASSWRQWIFVGGRSSDWWAEDWRGTFRSQANKVQGTV